MPGQASSQPHFTVEEPFSGPRNYGRRKSHGWAPLFVRVQAETALAVYMDDLKIFFRDLQLGVPDPNLWGMVTAVGSLDRICNA